MFIHDFKELEQEMQAQVVCMRGQYLGERSRDGWLIVLYQVSSFYVEVIFQPHNGSLISFHASEKEEVLDPYLDKISLSGLIPALVPAR
jgi:hypothetical protein